MSGTPCNPLVTIAGSVTTKLTDSAGDSPDLTTFEVLAGSGENPVRVRYDFGEPVSASRFVIQGQTYFYEVGSDGDFARYRLALYGSEDGVNWTLIYPVTEYIVLFLDDPGGYDPYTFTCTFASVTYRHFEARSWIHIRGESNETFTEWQDARFNVLCIPPVEMAAVISIPGTVTAGLEIAPVLLVPVIDFPWQMPLVTREPCAWQVADSPGGAFTDEQEPPECGVSRQDTAIGIPKRQIRTVLPL